MLMKFIKSFIRWLAKVFEADITVTKTVTKTVTEYRYLPPGGGVLEGDLRVDGDLVVDGRLLATGGVSCKLEAGKEVEDGTR